MYRNLVVVLMGAIFLLACGESNSSREERQRIIAEEAAEDVATKSLLQSEIPNWSQSLVSTIARPHVESILLCAYEDRDRVDSYGMATVMYGCASRIGRSLIPRKLWSLTLDLSDVRLSPTLSTTHNALSGTVYSHRGVTLVDLIESRARATFTHPRLLLEAWDDSVSSLVAQVYSDNPAIEEWLKLELGKLEPLFAKNEEYVSTYLSDLDELEQLVSNSSDSSKGVRNTLRRAIQLYKEQESDSLGDRKVTRGMLRDYRWRLRRESDAGEGAVSGWLVMIDNMQEVTGESYSPVKEAVEEKPAIIPEVPDTMPLPQQAEDPGEVANNFQP